MSDLEALKVDVDTRLLTLWVDIWSPNLDAIFAEDEALHHLFAAAIRAAYTVGYTHALREDTEGRRGALFADTGYPIP